MEAQWLLETLPLYWVIPFHVVIVLWILYQACINVIIVFLHGKYMSTLLGNLLHLLSIFAKLSSLSFQGSI